MTRASSSSSVELPRPRRAGPAGAVRGGGRLVRCLSESQARLDDERIAAVHGRRPGHRRVELALDLLVQAVEDRLLADGRDAVRRRRHDLGRLDGLVERLGVGAVNVARPRVRRQLGGLADLLGDGGGDAAEVAGEESRERVALGVVEHPEENAELDAVGMRLDLARLRRQLLDRPRILPALAFRRRGRRASRADWRWPPARETRPPRRGPSGSAPRSPASPGCPADAPSRSSCSRRSAARSSWCRSGPRSSGRPPARPVREVICTGLPVVSWAYMPGRGDTDALLPAAHAQPVELRAVEQLGEDRRNLLADDAGPVVDDGDPEARGLAGRRWRGVPSLGATSSVTTTSGRMPASSAASSALSTASLTQVRSAFRGLSKPRRWRFLVKNSETEISRWRAPISAADTTAFGSAVRRLGGERGGHLPP